MFVQICPEFLRSRQKVTSPSVLYPEKISIIPLSLNSYEDTIIALPWACLLLRFFDHHTLEKERSVAAQIKTGKAENRVTDINYYRRGVTIASFLLFSITFFFIILFFRLISSLFVVLEYSFQSFKKLKFMEIGAKEMTTRPKTGRERRQYPRFDVYWPIQYNHAGSPVSQNGRVTNLSEGGMLIQSPGQMEIGQHLKSKVSFILGSRIDTIELQAEVMWKDIHLHEVKGEYRCGARFLGISTNDKTKLDSLLMSLSQQSPYPS